MNANEAKTANMDIACIYSAHPYTPLSLKKHMFKDKCGKNFNFNATAEH